MKKNLQTGLDKKDVILLIIIFVLIIINLILFINKVLLPKKEEEQKYIQSVIVEPNKKETQIVSIPKTEAETLKYLSTLSERDRMEYYCGKYFNYLENKEYEKAYNLLYDEFKQNYFPTLEKFVEYVKKTYPSDVALEYNDITRQGYIYVLRLKILDVLGSKENEKVQRIVIKENNYNNFVVSFQVI